MGALEPPVMKTIREILLNAKQKADNGERTALKNYLVNSSGAPAHEDHCRSAFKFCTPNDSYGYRHHRTTFFV
jgi:hypothetical protein